MFFLLRVTLVVGAIFYLSPVRPGGGRAGLDSPPAPRHGSGVETSSDVLDEAERLWRSLPREAQEAVIERLRGDLAAVLEGAGAAPRPVPEPPRRP
ncbi:MAG TPA: hypothetical protein VHL98_19200 [Microvirga sp.]|jgi:hypothetical protein|nr:hypothetical protein [Microvirga sp.]